MFFCLRKKEIFFWWILAILNSLYSVDSLARLTIWMDWKLSHFMQFFFNQIPDQPSSGTIPTRNSRRVLSVIRS